MQSDRPHKTAPDADPGLPRPRNGARWRWSTPRRALVAGGALAAVLGLGASAAGAATSTAGTRAGAHGRPPAGSARPTVAGKITAVSGDDVTVRTRDATTTHVVVSSATTFKTLTGPKGAASTSGASALAVGRFIAVQGTKNSDGTVAASSVVVSTRTPPGGPGGPGGPGRGTSPPVGAPSA